MKMDKTTGRQVLRCVDDAPSWMKRIFGIRRLERMVLAGHLIQHDKELLMRDHISFAYWSLRTLIAGELAFALLYLAFGPKDVPPDFLPFMVGNAALIVGIVYQWPHRGPLRKATIQWLKHIKQQEADNAEHNEHCV